ncbi:MAG: GNAT family N-acetyltransferase [Anaerolineaceae bacterium]
MSIAATALLPIQPAGLRDLWSLRRLEKLTFHREDAWPIIELIVVLVWPSIVRLKVESDGQMIAFVAGEMHPRQGIGWITTLGVAPAWRRQGIGERLLAAAEQAMRLPVIRLTVRASNQAAIALYQKAGYSQVGVSRRYYVGGEDGLIFEKRIPIE